ncbi:ribonuclease P protein component [Coralloluteibacterium stylophorae]|uniref:Ribonuclease P protein component n=2 Tax=Coralloluteibacterium stylophorae TaxID=1776034 RepID=A0A8J7VS94_9GAMM|nr:ribonuclease P protein component [Coralloluteibacterium stylophorae]MBS7458962.1 ribonuclease P protein component [Coralloluteibacterium stylophorae]
MVTTHPQAAFPRSLRVRASADYGRVFADCRRVHGKAWRLHVQLRTAQPSGEADRDVPRLGLAVSRRVSKRAVERNRIKRTGRESFRRVAASLPPGDYVLVAKPEAATCDNAALRADLERLWARVATLNPPGGDGTMPRDAAAAPAGTAS